MATEGLATQGTKASLPMVLTQFSHDDVIKWKHFPSNWPFGRGIHRSPVNFPHKGQWRGALMFSLICAWINDWVNNREADSLRRYRAHYDVIVTTSVVVNTLKPGHKNQILQATFSNTISWTKMFTCRFKVHSKLFIMAWLNKMHRWFGLWLRHGLGKLTALLTICVENPPITGSFLHIGSVMGALISIVLVAWTRC